MISVLPRTTGRFVERRNVPAVEFGWRRIAIVVAAVLAVMVDQTATSIFGAAQTYVAGELAATPDESSWLGTVTSATYEATVIASIWAIARFGRKRVLAISLFGFALCSFASSAASDYTTLLALRALTGIFLGGIFTSAVLLLFATMPAKALPFTILGFALISLSGSLIGPVIGGSIAENFSGSTAFLPGAIVAVVAGSLVATLVRRDEDRSQGLSFDSVGYGLLLVAFGALHYLANEGERHDWLADPASLLAAALLPFAAAAFVAWEFYGARVPLADLRILARYRNAMVGCALSLVLGALGYAVTVFSQFLQTELDATPTLAGLLVALRLAAYLGGVPLAFALGRSGLVPPKTIAAVGLGATAVAFVVFSQSMTSTADAGAFVALTLGLGLLLSAASQPIPGIFLGSLDERHLPGGLALYKICAPVGLALGGAVAQTLLDHRGALHRAELAGGVALHSASVARFVDGGAHAMGQLGALVAQQAQTLAFADVTASFAAFAVAGAAIVLFAQSRPPAPDAAAQAIPARDALVAELEASEAKAEREQQRERGYAPAA
jgi:DHA2 family multidrug resistance protein